MTSAPRQRPRPQPPHALALPTQKVQSAQDPEKAAAYSEAPHTSLLHDAPDQASPPMSTCGPEASSDQRGDTPYAVGYARPPQHTQFKKGQSGNPRGRPRKDRSLASIADSELSKRITVRRGGEPVRITKGQALVANLVNSAVNGDKSAIAPLIKLLALGNLETSAKRSTGKDRGHATPPPSDDILDQDGLQVLADHLKRLGVMPSEDDAVLRRQSPTEAGAPNTRQE